MCSSEVDEDMARTIFVGGLPRTNTDEGAEELREFLWEIFSEFGADAVNIISGKGFAFVAVRFHLIASQNIFRFVFTSCFILCSCRLLMRLEVRLLHSTAFSWRAWMIRLSSINW
jgi:hypothetical protein